MAILRLMGMRREARERAIQFLYQYDLNPEADLDAALAAFWDDQHRARFEPEPVWTGRANEEPPPPTSREAAVRLFADGLIRGALTHRDEADAVIQRHARNWSLNRMATLDLNILRLAIYEMLHRQDIPPVVSINEAVDLAKKFSTHDSGKFVNGILDRVRQDILRPARMAE